MSSFTALNGASPKLAEPRAMTADQSPGPEDRPPNLAPMPPQSGPLEASSSSSSMRRESWTLQNVERGSRHSADYPEVEGSHKRKRSGSDEPGEDVSAREHSPGTGPGPDHVADSRDHYSTSQRDHRSYSDEQGTNRDRDRDRDKEPSWYSHHHHHHPHLHQGRDESTAYESQQTSAATPGQSSKTDEQIEDALRRAAGSMDHGDYGATSPDGEDGTMQQMYGAGAYTPEHRQDSSMLQHDPKKRKRNFSNRTKTGCLTCRKRKKKCDESKPECSNCIRGGFLCAGYPPQRGPGWQKPDSKAATVPLESKDPSYVPPGAYGMPQPQPAVQQQAAAAAAAQQQTPQQQAAQHPQQRPTQQQQQQQQQEQQQQQQPAAGSSYGPQQVKRDSISHYRGQVLRIDPPQGRPLATSDDDRPTASTMASASVASPDNKLSALPFTPANAFPTPISANTQAPPLFGERMVKDYQRVPPLHDLSRTEPETGAHQSTQLGGQLPQINILHPTRTSSPTPRPPPPSQQQQQQQHQQQQQQQQQQQPAMSNPQMTAQLALSQSQYPARRTQKEEMLSGRQFYPFDKELCLERERCATACWRFNNLTSPPMHGVSAEERARLFLEILQPRDPVRVPPTEASSISNVGRVGRHVAVETPFVCDYGYNISIGHHVVIGRNCTINDVCEVKIGDNCVIGPNVSIFTASLPMDPKKRQGGQGPQYGKAVVIEPDCFIGGGAIILPGRTIGKGSTVGAGSIVTKDVPPFTIVAGNPARVLRGIAS